MPSNSTAELVVCCLTRDRPRLFGETLRAIVADVVRFDLSSARIVVIDDSCNHENACTNRCTVENFDDVDVIYHGRSQQTVLIETFCRASHISRSTLTEFIRPLGSKSCDLGAVRNYAGFLALAFADDQCVIVQIDDDVRLTPSVAASGVESSSLAVMYGLVLNNYEIICGACLEGVPDSSTMERELLKCVHSTTLSSHIVPEPPVPVSGGLMAFSQLWMETVPFPRIYNEDWIWLISCRVLGAKVIRSSIRSIHVQSPDGSLNKKTLQREQFGEVFCEGWNEAHSGGYETSFASGKLQKDHFWKGILREEFQYLDKIRDGVILKISSVRDVAAQAELNHVMYVLECTRSILQHIVPDTLVEFARRYICGIKKWRQITQHIGYCIDAEI